MSDTRLIWSVIHAEFEELEATLNRLSDTNYEVFAVHPDEGCWAIIARKSVPDDTRKGNIGFAQPSR